MELKSIRAQFMDYFTALGYVFDEKDSKECTWMKFDGKGKRWDVEVMLYSGSDNNCFMAKASFESKDMYKDIYPDGIRVKSMEEVKFLYKNNNAFYKVMAPGAI